jgi:uncharacterized protein (TIGR00725 family)
LSKIGSVDSAVMQIGVIGPGANDATTEQYYLAREVGRLLAERGARVICGGLRGVMEGVARGVYEAQGTCVGLLPGADRADANPYLSVAVCTGVGEKRNEMVVDSSDAIIAVGSNEGTLIETLIAKKRGISVFGLGFDDLAIGGRRLNAVITVSSPADAVNRAVDAARVRS